ncbi:GIY-YIG nuclease family protein [Erythrobacter sp. GH3-10]|uniref:GIY-YIG nuclease family protein n=2 Tax=Aurantiacibacter rhizosphaerae TaxID=2691582 RepID=A0A844XCB5_9SPHN|nr:GIY-YIG nuclease family protein [Aurantiacibacter rhizosphaerae]
MALRFNMLLQDEGYDPREVRLLRHQHVAKDGLTPYALWRDRPGEFERYQSAQKSDRSAYFASRYWAAFVVPPDGSTLFVGLYEIGDCAPVATDWIDPLMRQTSTQIGRALDIYQFERVPAFDHYAGRVRVEWGDGTRAWAQRASNRKGDKPVVELAREFREPDFPGFTNFIGNFGGLPSLPQSWVMALSAARGVYLLTCPRTFEQYVGSACGTEGFWGRWKDYAVTGHGGNIRLKSRDASDYQVSILEVAGSAATTEQILAMEQLWKRKLQSRDMGLNAN